MGNGGRGAGGDKKVHTRKKDKKRNFFKEEGKETIHKLAKKKSAQVMGEKECKLQIPQPFPITFLMVHP